MTGKIKLTPTHEPKRKQIEHALERNETGDSELLEFMFRGQILYDVDAEEWYIYSGQYWREDKKSIIKNLIANEVADEYHKVAAYYWMKHKSGDDGNDEIAQQFQSRCFKLRGTTRIKKVLQRAESHPGLVVRSDVWQVDPFELPAQNGIINLRDGTLRQSKPEDYIRHPIPTNYLPFDAPIFEKFILEICEGDKEKVNFLQRLFGYAITGSNKEHVMPILVGAGRNGKDTLLAAFQYALGDICSPVGQEVMLDSGRNPNAASPHIFNLMFKRLAYVSETQDGSRLDSGMVKWITGGGRLTARMLYGNPIEFEPQHLLVLLTNFKPVVNADDFALWERLLLLEFNLSYVDNPTESHHRQADKDLPEKLKKEAVSILKWLVDGCLAWQQEGLNIPESVKKATQAYQSDEDKLLHFIQDEMVEKPGKKISASLLYTYYQEWSKINGYHPLGSKRFHQKIGLKKKREKDGQHYIGIEPSDIAELEAAGWNITEPQSGRKKKG